MVQIIMDFAIDKSYVVICLLSKPNFSDLEPVHRFIVVRKPNRALNAVMQQSSQAFSVGPGYLSLFSVLLWRWDSNVNII